MFNVGNVYAKAMESSNRNIAERIGSTKKKATHIRQAHWHSYWTGSGVNKRLILKWLNPMIINPTN